MITDGKHLEEKGVLDVARKMCIAARTAPKTKGQDHIVTLVLTGEEKNTLAAKTEEIGWRDYGEQSSFWFEPDANAIRQSQAVVLIGCRKAYRGVPQCGWCGFENCKACMDAGGNCAYLYTDLGIAAASAAMVAGQNWVDNRMMWSAGKAVAELGYMEGCYFWLAIPLSVSGKNVFFDRRRKKTNSQN